jgi:anti-repressor protein
LISRSNAPNAEPFQDWVCEEVLPSIRKTGSYGHNSQQQFDLTSLDPDAMLEALINVQQLRKEEKAKLLELQEEKAKLEVRLEAQTPAVKAIKRLAASEGAVNIQQAAKALKMRPTDLTNHMFRTSWLYMRPPSTRKIAYQEKNQTEMDGLPPGHEVLIWRSRTALCPVQNNRLGFAATGQ